MEEPAKLVLAHDPAIVPRDDGGASVRIQAEIRRLGLIENAWELDTQGYTVVKPGQIGSPTLAAQLRDRILDFSERQTGVRPDLATGASHDHFVSKFGRAQMMKDILYFDPLFEQAVMEPSVLALVTYLLGENCILDIMNGSIKAPGPEHVPLHLDTVQPVPLPPYAQVVNASWILSDYTLADGPTCILPGSHKYCRYPFPEEATNYAGTVAIEAPAGSVLIWHGNTWHGALPRTAPGLRISLVTFFQRWYMRLQNGHADKVTPEMLARNDPRFATLVGVDASRKRPGYVTRGSQFA